MSDILRRTRSSKTADDFHSASVRRPVSVSPLRQDPALGRYCGRLVDVTSTPPALRILAERIASAVSIVV